MDDALRFLSAIVLAGVMLVGFLAVLVTTKPLPPECDGQNKGRRKQPVARSDRQVVDGRPALDPSDCHRVQCGPISTRRGDEPCLSGE